MAIDKGLMQAPQGMDDDLPDAEMLEIEIVDPEEVTLSDGSVEITLVPGSDEDIETKFEDNLAEKLDLDITALAGLEKAPKTALKNLEDSL